MTTLGQELRIQCQYKSFCTTFLLCVLTYLLVTTIPFLSPFSPTTPYHSDFWSYFNGMNKSLTASDFLKGRPLSLVLVRVMGGLGLGEKQAMLFCSVFSFLAISSCLLACESLARRPVNLNLRICYVFVAMTTPAYFLIQQWEFGGVVATIFFCFALILACKPTSTLRKFFILIVLYLSFEFKPTWMAGAPMAFGAIWLTNRNTRKDAFVLLILSAALGGAILLKDYYLASPFIKEFQDSAHPYAIGNLWQILSGFYYYAAFTMHGASLALLVLLILIFRCDYKIIFITLVVAIGALIPIATLPNHMLPMYSWYATLFVLGSVAATQSARWDVVTSTGRFARHTPAIGQGVMLLVVVMLSAKYINSVDRNFYLNSQKVISGDVKVLNEIRGLPQGTKLLVGAMKHPFSPFNNYQYANRISGEKLRLDYVIRKDFIWRHSLTPPVTPVNVKTVRIEDYDYLVDLSPPSGIPALVAVANLSSIERENYRQYLYCPQLSILRYEADTSAKKISEKAKCLIDVGDTDGPTR